MKNKLLFELGTEEIPADMISPAVRQMRSTLERVLKENQLDCESIETYSTPRRLAVLLSGLPELQPDRQELVVGPPASVGVDNDGNPTKAGEGFARKLGIAFDELEVSETERGPYLTYRKAIAGKSIPEIFAGALPDVISSMNWPKNMYWSESRFRFIRPLRWYLALWNDQVVPFEFQGVRSGNITRGHRFLGKPDIELKNADEYVERLRDNFVLVDSQERRNKIARGLEEAIPRGLRLVDDPGLLEMVVDLNEFPHVLRGGFDASFLKIPQEVLITVMRHHQKYFSLVNERGDLQPFFLTVLNTDGDPEGGIRQGHERVLRARLEDAQFFWESDRKIRLQDRVEDLRHVLFQERLGSYLDKTDRVRAVCSEMSQDRHLDTAASLCKVDLTTDMVREFTELQGVIGGLYAREEGHPEEVWKAIYEHYLPLALEDAPPSTLNGALLSVADKIDTITGCFGIGIVPTGSSDPFALRRQAQGLVKVLLERQMDYSLPQLVEIAQKNFAAEKQTDTIRRGVLDFLEGRVRYLLQDREVAYDVINAILAVGVGRVHQAYEKALALTAIRAEPDFEVLATAYKRIKNILANQPVEDAGISESLLQESAELELYRAYQQSRPKVTSNIEDNDFTAALREMARLRPQVDQFFDDVMVLVNEERLRTNRLRLLHGISQLFLQVADISEIVRGN